jgi:hypothetical protein
LAVAVFIGGRRAIFRHGGRRKGTRGVGRTIGIGAIEISVGIAVEAVDAVPFHNGRRRQGARRVRRAIYIQTIRIAVGVFVAHHGAILRRRRGRNGLVAAIPFGRRTVVGRHDIGITGRNIARALGTATRGAERSQS